MYFVTKNVLCAATHWNQDQSKWNIDFLTASLRSPMSITISELMINIHLDLCGNHLNLCRNVFVHLYWCVRICACVLMYTHLCMCIDVHAFVYWNCVRILAICVALGVEHCRRTKHFQTTKLRSTPIFPPRDIIATAVAENSKCIKHKFNVNSKNLPLSLSYIAIPWKASKMNMV